MSPKLKALTTAFIAVLALNAFMAQTASAHDFKSEADRTVLTGEGRSVLTFTFGAGKLSCKNIDLSGTTIGTKLDTVTLHPTYLLCTIGVANVPVKTTGCNLIVGSDTTSSTHLTGMHASLSIECAAGKKIEAVGPGCTVTIEGNAANQGLHGVTFVNEGTGVHRDIKATATVRTIHYEAIGASCALAGITPGTSKNGMFDGSVTVEGFLDKCEVNGEGKDIECPFVPFEGTDADEYTHGNTPVGVWFE